MKYLLFALIFFMCSCEAEYVTDKRVENKNVRVVFNDFSMSLFVVEVDGCEYVISRVASGTAMVHKPNCKNHIRFNNIDLRWDVDSTDIGAK